MRGHASFRSDSLQQLQLTEALDLSRRASLREVIIYKPRDIGLEFFFLDLSPKNRLQPIHDGGLYPGIYCKG